MQSRLQFKPRPNKIKIETETETDAKNVSLTDDWNGHTFKMLAGHPLLNVIHWNRFYPAITASGIMANLLEEVLPILCNGVTSIITGGRRTAIPRQQAGFGDTGLTFNYSHTVVNAHQWTSTLSGLRDTLLSVTGVAYNFALVNRYADGNQYIGHHRDDTTSLVALSPIACFSFGATRDFVLRQDNESKQPSLSVPLQNGSLLIMQYPTNRFWTHSIPKRVRLTGVRISVTFRCIQT